MAHPNRTLPQTIWSAGCDTGGVPDREAADAVRRAQLVADTVLFPRAQDVDQGTTDLSGGLTALADAGLFGIAGPLSHGGSDLGRQDVRRVIAAVASGCGATFFVWVQHHGVIGTLRSSPNSELVDTLLAPMCAGELVAGVAFAHVRRAGPPAVRATRLDDGAWQLDGHAPWVTSWGIADWFCVAAESADGSLVWSMIPATDTSGHRRHPARPRGPHRHRNRRPHLRLVPDPQRARRRGRGRRPPGGPSIDAAAPSVRPRRSE